MELHHKLRRDPNWHPSACNICGQLGHQAANCTNGTINWRQIYGDAAFTLRAPIYSSEYDAAKKKKEVDLADLEKRAREYAQSKAGAQALAGANGAAAAVAAAAQPPVEAGMPLAANGAAAAPAPAAAAPQEAPLPAGWAQTKDAQGRMYYWHTKTKKTQWDRPTADTPIQ